MSNTKIYRNPNTGNVYNLEKGEKIDPVKEGIGCTGEYRSPTATLRGKKKFHRIFVRLRTPKETLTCRPIEDGADFARRVSIIENWFNSVMHKGNMVLTFEAMEITEEQADEMLKGTD